MSPPFRQKSGKCLFRLRLQSEKSPPPPTTTTTPALQCCICGALLQSPCYSPSPQCNCGALLPIIGTPPAPLPLTVSAMLQRWSFTPPTEHIVSPHWSQLRLINQAGWALSAGGGGLAPGFSHAGSRPEQWIKLHPPTSSSSHLLIDGRAATKICCFFRERKTYAFAQRRWKCVSLLFAEIYEMLLIFDENIDVLRGFTYW